MLQEGRYSFDIATLKAAILDYSAGAQADTAEICVFVQSVTQVRQLEWYQAQIKSAIHRGVAYQSFPPFIFTYLWTQQDSIKVNSV